MSTTVERPSPAPVRQKPVTSGFGPLLLRLHFYAGVLVAPFLLVAALTGLAYVFTPQMEKIVYAHELTVTTTGDQSLTVAKQVAAARAALPEGTPTAIRPGSGDATTQIDFALPALDEEHQRTVYVNPYTGEVTGQLTTWYATTPLKTWFDDMHRNLHLGVAGRYYSEFAASWLWVLTLGGLALWWRRQRGRRMLTPDLAAKKGVRRTRSWHASLGVWLTLGLLLLSATGLTWSRYAGGHFADALDAFRGSTPSVSTSLDGAAAPVASGHHAGMAMTTPASADVSQADAVLSAARADGIDGPVELAIPADATTAWTVTQTRNLWPVGRDSVAVDGRTGKIIDRVDFADWPLTAKLTRWGVNAHMGTLFGLVNQLLLAALAIGLICVIVWGYRMWWQRRPTRALAGRPLGTRGAWQGIPAWAVVAGVPSMLFVGWALPLLGVPLAAFLLVDVLLGIFRSRRAKPTAPVSPAPAPAASA